MKQTYKVVFKRGLTIVATIHGINEVVDTDLISVAEMGKVIEAEQLLEKLTGYRVHIEQVS